MNRNAATRRAFTLVEIMISIAILSVVIGAMYATWRAIMSATKVGQTAAAEVQRSRIALRCLEESLTYAEMFAANYRYYGFVAENGSDATLSFVAHLPGDFPRSGRFGAFSVRRVEYSLISGGEGGRDLVLRQAPLLMDFDQDEREHPLVLLKNVKRMEMAFWDMQKMDWTDEWLQTNQMPKLVRIAITTENPKNPFAAGEEYTRIISPAAAAVQPGWQAQGIPAAAPTSTPGNVTPIRPR